MNVSAHIEALFIYPVKSLAGVPLQNANLTQSGLKGDRQWAIVKENGQVLTQRELPELALITPNLTDNGITLSHPSGGEIEVSSLKIESEPFDLRVWKDTCSARTASIDAGQWLQNALNYAESLSLVNIAPSTERVFNKPNRFSISGSYFSDAAPYLLANNESLQSLNEHLASQDKSPVDIRHFRPNIVVSGISAFSEHQYKTLKDPSDSFELRLVDHCQRCVMITIDPDTGTRPNKSQPFTELAQINAMPNQPKAPAFGVNSTLTLGNNATVTVGQKLEIL